MRSDAWVAVELGAGGGVEIDLRSRVDPYYGGAIRAQIEAIARALGVLHAKVEVHDSGALPFVLAARVEAAFRRAGVTSAADVRSEAADFAHGSTPRLRPRRSRLYLPGQEPKFFINAGLHEPDGIILDLEDSVHPQEKDTARLLVRNALRSVDFRRAERMVRINPLPLGLADLREIVPERPDVILIPKVEHAEQVREVAREAPGPWLMPILESALGIEHAFEIASASERVAALTLGLEDYAADLGVPKSVEGDESLYARMRVVNAARAAGVQAIDSVYGQVDDVEGLRRWCLRSRRLGFCGMGCLHPRQIALIHEAYNPTAGEIERALAIMIAFEQAQAAGLGVVSLGSKMIDPPVIEQARYVVEQARARALLPAADPS